MVCILCRFFFVFCEKTMAQLKMKQLSHILLHLFIIELSRTSISSVLFKELGVIIFLPFKHNMNHKRVWNAAWFFLCYFSSCLYLMVKVQKTQSHCSQRIFFKMFRIWKKKNQFEFPLETGTPWVVSSIFEFQTGDSS